MASRFSPGDVVQTPFGKGVVRELRNGGRLMVDVLGRAIEFVEREISVAEAGGKRSRGRPIASESGSESTRPKRQKRIALAEVDLHGLTIDEALGRVDQALNDALLADLQELRLIHGRSGGRIRAALHRRLRETPSVKFRLDPRNEGVTIVSL